MAYTAPPLLLGQLAAFDADLRVLLDSTSATGRFWDWPDDTEVLLARKPAQAVR